MRSFVNSPSTTWASTFVDIRDVNWDRTRRAFWGSRFIPTTRRTARRSCRTRCTSRANCARSSPVSAPPTGGHPGPRRGTWDCSPVRSADLPPGSLPWPTRPIPWKPWVIAPAPTCTRTARTATTPAALAPPARTCATRRRWQAPGFATSHPVRALWGCPGQASCPPGAPDDSVLLLRMLATDASRMPPVASSVVDAAGTQLIADWITQLTCP